MSLRGIHDKEVAIGRRHRERRGEWVGEEEDETKIEPEMAIKRKG